MRKSQVRLCQGSNQVRMALTSSALLTQTKEWSLRDKPGKRHRICHQKCQAPWRTLHHQSMILERCLMIIPILSLLWSQQSFQATKSKYPSLLNSKLRNLNGMLGNLNQIKFLLNMMRWISTLLILSLRNLMFSNFSHQKWIQKNNSRLHLWGIQKEVFMKVLLQNLQWRELSLILHQHLCLVKKQILFLAEGDSQKNFINRWWPSLEEPLWIQLDRFPNQSQLRKPL